MQKLLITGANGFAGQHLIKLLSDSYEITGLVHNSTLKSDNTITYLSGNILDRGFLEDVIKNTKPDKIIHLAAIAPTWTQDPENIFKINLFGTLNLYMAVYAVKNSSGLDPKIIYVSSAECYGKTLNPEKIVEGSPFFPANYYGSSKVAADRLSYQTSQSLGLNIIIVRPFNHTGPGQLKGFFVPDMASQIAEIEKDPSKNEIKVGNLDSIRDISDVRDIAQGYKKILETDAPIGEAYNICTGVGIKMHDLLKKLLSFANKPIKIIQDPDRLRPSEIQITVGNNTKFRSLTGWEPKISLDQTLKETLEFWRENQKPEI